MKDVKEELIPVKMGCAVFLSNPVVLLNILIQELLVNVILKREQ